MARTPGSNTIAPKSTIMYGSRPIKEIYLGTPGSSRLPSDYQEVEYIESSGTQYIDTLFTPTNKTKVEFKLSDWTETGSHQIFGADYDWTVRGYSMLPEDYNFYYPVSLSHGLNNGGVHTGEMSQTGIYVDGVLKATPSTYTFTSDCTMTLFCLNRNNRKIEFTKNKFYYFKIYESGELVRDLVPCYRKSDNEIGLYDLVNNQFYTNGGSGTFTKGADVKSDFTAIKEVYYGSKMIRPDKKVLFDCYYSDANFEEYQSLVNEIGSVQFVDTGKRFRFDFGVYIGNRTALDFRANSNVMRTINLDTLTSTSKTLSVTMPNSDFTVYYFGDNRILTPRGILDFNGNVITSFSYDSIVPGLPGVVRANSGYDIYKGIVTGDNVSFTKVGTSSEDQFAGLMYYSRLGAYLINHDDNRGSGYSAYVNPVTNTVTSFPANTDYSRLALAVSGPDGNLYRKLIRNNGWGRFQRITTTSGDLLGTSLSTSWLDYGNRRGKFLGNIVSGGMSSSNGTGNGYGTPNYFVGTEGNVTKVQNQAFSYDTGVISSQGFIDENGRIYPKTYGGGSGVILKTDKTFKDLNWRNPYLFR